MENIKTTLREFIAKYVNNNGFSNDDDLFTNGYVNSLFAMELVMYIENQFNTKLENQELDLKNFRSINTIAALINEKTKI